MSEYYKLRRTKITDGLALSGFILGFLVPTYAAGKRLVEGFETGYESQGLGYFVLSILGSGLLGGVIGLIVGIVAGWIWERVHKTKRPAEGVGTETAAVEVRPAVGTSGFASSMKGSVVDERPRKVAADTSLRYAQLQYDSGRVSGAEFLSLLQSVSPGDYDLARASEALARTTNIGAWHDDKLVGVVRVLSDGYMFATVPEIMVEEDYRRRGIGTELMRRALNAAPTGIVFFGSPPEAIGFFEKIGCRRAPGGFVLRRSAPAAARVETK